tara:strand:- start:2734 stop:3333 length:600 start_codon:yes stop_codon:yes gene_type:complete
MSRSDKLIYSFLVLSLIVIIYIFYNSFSKQEAENILINEKTTTSKKIDSKVTSKEENVIESIEYYSIDNYGNKFEVKAKEGVANKKNASEIFLKDVDAQIILANMEVVKITSKTADYNKDNLITNFKGNVNINYLSHEIISEELNLFFKSRIATISNEVRYIGLNTNIQTDNIKIDFNNKSSKIFMDSKDKKIKINSNY